MTNRDAEPPHIGREDLLSASPPAYLDQAVLMSTVCLIGFSMLALLGGGLMLLRTWQQDRHALRATGEVVEVRGRADYTVRYADDRNVTHTADAHLFNLTNVPKKGLSVGQRLPVLYRRGSEHRVSLENETGDVIATIFWVGIGVAPLIYVFFLRRRLRRHKERYARLQRDGISTAVESVRSQTVAWGRFKRWALVASWRDPAGHAHETMAGPFHYDPMPVDPSTLRVLADRTDPAQSGVDPETLPPLDHAKRRPGRSSF
ncbi:hypothetical protein [Tahibacter caeni]|uniref:hypothetical protein n=1 Tax=Tahibacter caeni TaxID=1453545 RepID=UPI00214749CC|nr:hypothetical protein [Tahibacter caeni]